MKTEGENNRISIKFDTQLQDRERDRENLKELACSCCRLMHMVGQLALSEVLDKREGLVKILHFCGSIDGRNKHY